jgi:hypothetical protein
MKGIAKNHHQTPKSIVSKQGNQISTPYNAFVTVNCNHNRDRKEEMRNDKAKSRKEQRRQ